MCGVIMFCSSNFDVAHGFSYVGFSAGTVAFVNNMGWVLVLSGLSLKMLLIFRVCHKMWTEYLLSVNEFSLAVNFLLSFSLRSQNDCWMDIFFLSSKRKSGISFSFASSCLCMKLSIVLETKRVG